MRSAVSVVLILVAVASGACGDEDDSASPPREETPAAATPTTELELVAPRRGSAKFRFDKRRLRAQAGTITIKLTNEDDHQHNVRVHAGTTCCFEQGWRDLGGTPTISRGEPPTSGTVELKPGRYVFLCDITGHWSEGMWGRLTVQ